MDIPKDKNYPTDSVQCDECGGWGLGCEVCDNKGWLTPQNHPKGRRCLYLPCSKPLDPAQIAIYDSNDCALNDA